MESECRTVDCYAAAAVINPTVLSETLLQVVPPRTVIKISRFGQCSGFRMGKCHLGGGVRTAGFPYAFLKLVNAIEVMVKDKASCTSMTGTNVGQRPVK